LINIAIPPLFFPTLSNIGRQYIPAWPKMLTLPSLRQAVYESGDTSPHIDSKRAGIEILKKEDMNSKSMVGIVSAFCLALALSTVAQSQAKKSLRDEVIQSEKAARVFREIMDTPDKGIRQELLDGAECVAVFPSALKAGFIFGGRGGRGVASCRTAMGWSAQAYFILGGGSFGLQIGAQSTDFVMLFMNKDGLNSLLSDEFTLGADASVAAGPVGRQAGASTDLKFNAQILSYSRSKGLFAGLELKGVVIKPDKEDMRDVYGEGVTAKEVLKDNKVIAPVAVRAFPTTLGRYSLHRAVE
jgi:SH3 domain-containing YSC84-like protein 1